MSDYSGLFSTACVIIAIKKTVMTAMSETLRIRILCYSIVLWFAGIYVRGCIRQSFFLRAIMKVLRNTVEGVRFTYFIKAAFVHVVEWH